MIKIVKTKTTENLKSDINKVIEPLGNIENFIKNGDKVLIKPNFNTADPYPASSSLDFLEAVIELVKTSNPAKIILGDSCTISQKTATVLKILDIFEFARRMEIEVLNFDKEKFIKKKIKGKYLNSIRIPVVLEEVDKLILLPCLKTHRYARFTMSIKLGVGFMKKTDRLLLHASHLEEKIAEINLAYQPDLIIMDGRQAFVTYGPEKGDLVKPNILMAGTDRIAIDIEALKILTSYQAENKLIGDIWQLPQIKRAIELNLGVKNENYYQSINL